MYKIVDLTHTLHNQISIYPGTVKPCVENIYNIGEHSFAETRLNILSHHGTHIDSPAHMIENAKSLDQFEAGYFFGRAICIDCKKVKNSVIDLNVLGPFEEIIRDVEFVLINTGWSDKWEMDSYCKDYPVLSTEACTWLANFSLKGIGLDTISIDKIDTNDFENHYIILGKGMIIIENLTNLKMLEKNIFSFSCFPIKYLNADGSPVRAVAYI